MQPAFANKDISASHLPVIATDGLLICLFHCISSCLFRAYVFLSQNILPLQIDTGIKCIIEHLYIICFPFPGTIALFICHHCTQIAVKPTLVHFSDIPLCFLNTDWWGQFRKFVKTLVDHRFFQRGILIAILVNTLGMGIEYHNQVRN